MVSRRSYTREFKIETVKLVTGGDSSVNQVASDMGIHPNTLYDGSSSFQRSRRRHFPAKGIWLQRSRNDPATQARERAVEDGARHLKKSNGHLFQRPEMIFPFICNHQSEFPISLMCRVLRFHGAATILG